MSLVELVLPLCKRLGTSPAGLAAQMERAAISIPTNVAEGYGRSSRAEYAHFLSIAAGSLRELETHILIAERNRLIPFESARQPLALADETGRILHALRKSLGRTDTKGRRAPRWPSG